MRRNGLPCFVSLLIVVLIGCNANEKEGPPPYPDELPAASEDAVFGLSWSYNEEQLLNAGVIRGEPEPFRGKQGHMYTDVKLPRRFKDADWCALIFDEDGAMLRIACVGETVKDDPTGEAMRKRYEELKDAISRKIPIVETFEDKSDDWGRERDWWAALKEGKLHWATGFRGEVMEAVLEIRAETDRAGSYSLIVDNLRRMEEFNRTADQKDKRVF